MIGIGAILVAVLVILAVAYVRNSQEATKQNEQTGRSTESKNVDNDTSDTYVEGVFTSYSEPAVDSTSGRKVLFFHAPWCPQCRMIEADIKKSAIPSGVTIFKVDYDSNQDLRQKYGVTLQTTFVEIDNDRKLIDKYVAYNEPTFDSVKKNLIDE